jgi:DNA-binding NarL/FixJ family response regulator
MNETAVAERNLTDRERQILQALATGANNRQIARQLDIAEGTVRKHLEHAYAKLGVSTRTAALVKVLTTSTG